ncbi:MAG: proline dehydrogenase family protein [Deltaproteobacteria bacterium]|jgi:proline dehydrogenase|nr:proline dehydrogenase family protein [Deltaproteobacteria bacterium]MCW8893562.1 proline dehydrogenase family protein [Deltaproteobacteria bacterium]MCW9049395.1 proline dehydrogenase family protein [Deltaproteobacteria bacterium]
MSLFNFAVSKTIMHVPKPIVSHFAKGYIAGSTLADAVRVTKDLNRQGMMTTIDILGEFITRIDQAISFKDDGLNILRTIEREKLDANLSIKPTQMGLLIDKDRCFEIIRELVAEAKKINNFVRIDIEDVTTTDDTFAFFRKLREEFPGHVGTAFQSYLRRTPLDVVDLADGYQNYRLCKGIYIESRKHAWKNPQAINRNFMVSLEKLLKQGAYVGIATHDELLVFEAMTLVREMGLKPDQYEFQMLLGVDEEMREIILAGGHRLRVYVPFGEDWLPYSKRRLKENPAIAQHALKQMLGINKH